MDIKKAEKLRLEIKALDRALKDFNVMKKSYSMKYIELGNKFCDSLFNSTSNVDNDFHLTPNKSLNFD